MTTITTRDFRSNMAACFGKVDAGERIFIRRNNKLYTIVSVDYTDLEVSASLQAKIDKARQEHLAGETIAFTNAAEAQKWMDEL